MTDKSIKIALWVIIGILLFALVWYEMSKPLTKFEVAVQNQLMDTDPTGNHEFSDGARRWWFQYPGFHVVITDRDKWEPGFDSELDKGE